MVALLLALGCARAPVDIDPRAPGAFDPTEQSVMYGFSWVDEPLAAMPLPRGGDLVWMASEGVDVLVTLTLDPLDPIALEQAGLESIHLPIPDFQAPTDAQIESFIGLMKDRTGQGQRVGVHCYAGLGRSGTMAALWFVNQGLTAEEAIAKIRELRPGSVESAAQEESVARYAASLL